MGILVRFFCRIYGVHAEIIAANPDGIGMAALIGASICLTTLCEFCSGTYAAWRAFQGHVFAPAVSVCAGLLWAATIFIVDCALVRSVSKLSARQMGPLSLRLGLATVIAFTLATPFELSLLNPLLEQAVRADERSELTQELGENAAREHLQDRTAAAQQAETARAAQQKRLDGEPDSFEFNEASAAVKVTGQRYANVLDRNLPRIDALRNEAGAAKDEAKRSGLRESIRALQTEIYTASKDNQAAQAQLLAARRAWDQAESASLAELTEAARSTAEASRQASTRSQVRDRESESVLRILMRNTLVRDFVTLEHLKWDSKSRDRAAIWTLCLTINLVMMLVSCSPVLVKAMAETTSLDHMMNTQRIVETQRINLQAASQVAALQASALIRDSAMERLRDEKLHTIADPGTTKEELLTLAEEAEDQMVA